MSALAARRAAETGKGGKAVDQTNFVIVERTPSVEEYRELCESVGWGEIMNFEAARDALPRSLFAVVAESAGDAIGMGRIVGDGAIFFYVQDVAVRPSWQGRGVGRAVLASLTGWIRRNAPEKSLAGVFAIRGTEGFYESFGFAVHTNDVGMIMLP